MKIDNCICKQGLNILLNTCNKENLVKYTEFSDHVTCASLSREESVPVMNRRSDHFYVNIRLDCYIESNSLQIPA